MKNIIIGTAGHVDHGKTQLIKALSGIDTDRLEEEKKRGITIELGFAHIPNDQGYNIGVIDVPGHEKFIKNMLAGIGGIDFVLFVVAADEGIMPQTREHFEILQALGIKDGIIAVTKTDMVDQEWLDMLLEEVREYFKGSFLEGKPIVPVSARTGDNIDALKEEILLKCDREVKRIEDPRMFRLPVDRVFTMTGFGTVVTGTLLDGAVSVNEGVKIYPQGLAVKVRGVQNYGKAAERAVAGQRTAINLGGTKKESLDRGDVLACENAITVTSMLDVRLDVFKSSERTVLNNSRVHLYQGSKDVLCKVILLDRDALQAGESAYAQLRLEEPVAIRRGDRFIIRFYSPLITIGGGVILDANPDKHKRNREDVLASLDILASSDVSAIIESKVSGRRIFAETELVRELGMLPEDFAGELEALLTDGRVVKLTNGYLLGAGRIEFFKQGIKDIIEKYHADNPLADGIPKQELLSRLRDKWHIDDDKIVNAIVTYMLENGIMTNKGKAVALAGFAVEHTAEQQELKRTIAENYAAAGIEMVRTDGVYAMADDRGVIAAMLKELVDEGLIVKVDPTYYVSADGWNKAVAAAVALGASGGFTLAEYRDKLGTSRKYASVFLQAFDKAGITRFDGDVRIVPSANS